MNLEQDEELHDAVGSKWTLTAFRRFLRENEIDDVALWKRIESCVARSLVSVESMERKTKKEFSICLIVVLQVFVLRQCR
jgi:hypothetical protein